MQQIQNTQRLDVVDGSCDNFRKEKERHWEIPSSVDTASP